MARRAPATRPAAYGLVSALATATLRWRALDARDYCAQILGLDGDDDRDGSHPDE